MRADKLALLQQLFSTGGLQKIALAPPGPEMQQASAAPPPPDAGMVPGQPPPPPAGAPQLMQDPQTGLLVDPATGQMFDPQTGAPVPPPGAPPPDAGMPPGQPPPPEGGPVTGAPPAGGGAIGNMPQEEFMAMLQDMVQQAVKSNGGGGKGAQAEMRTTLASLTERMAVLEGNLSALLSQGGMMSSGTPDEPSAPQEKKQPESPSVQKQAEAAQANKYSSPTRKSETAERLRRLKKRTV
jgi:hypothetical protein